MIPQELNKLLKSHWLNFDQYIREEMPKRQIVLHHSAGWDNARGMIDGWNKTATRVATAFGLEDEGIIYQAFSSKYWGWHIGLTTYSKYKKKFTHAHAKMLEQCSIGIEICNWGWLIKKGDKFYSYVNIEVPKEKVIEYPKGYRGHTFYERYTDKEIKSLSILLPYLAKIYGISLAYNEDMWDISDRAQKGDNGIWSHTSFRPDKVDVHPQPELIAMLKSLTSLK